MENEEDSATTTDLIECRNCEAQYSILLGEDFLHENSHYCPFCGDYNTRDEL
jgi:hypothetical protein